MCSGLFAWLLPFLGILKVLSRPQLLMKLIVPFIVTSALTLLALVLLPLFALKPQEALLRHWGAGWLLSDIVGTILIPVEAGLLCYIVFQLLFNRAITGIKMRAIEERGVDRTIMSRYRLHDLPSSGVIADLTSSVKFLFFQVVVLLSTMPMHVTPPGPGTLWWVWSNGWLCAWETQSDLLPMIGYSSTFSQAKHFATHLVSYFMFGFVAFGMMMIPFGNVLCGAGIAYGAAMLFEGFVNEGTTGPDGLPVPTDDSKLSSTSMLRQEKCVPFAKFKKGPKQASGRMNGRTDDLSPQCCCCNA
mmetsp:Transcript_10154/g.28354  ORF Transcript_10154/g.28354 Transcript_10154/m.28354 type:complete len:302 (-) Transcript_10154:183-1088(-)